MTIDTSFTKQKQDQLHRCRWPAWTHPLPSRNRTSYTAGISRNIIRIQMKFFFKHLFILQTLTYHTILGNVFFSVHCKTCRKRSKYKYLQINSTQEWPNWNLEYPMIVARSFFSSNIVVHHTTNLTSRITYYYISFLLPNSNVNVCLV